MNKSFLLLILIIIAAFFSIFIYKQFNSENKADKSSNEEISLSVDTKNTNEKLNINTDNKEINNIQNKKILITDGVKHSIPLDEVLSGGVPKDGIPSIDNPKFVDAKDADFLNDASVGLGVSYKNEQKFYPFSILVWHEIVNDYIKKDPVLVTYCPLCSTAIVFKREIDGTPVEFGVSGKLWQSNLLMYNRSNEEKESLWSQVLGEAVVGELTGYKLEIIPSDIVRFKSWKDKYPNTKVLSTDTGFKRNYSVDPYGNYYTSSETIFPTKFNDKRLDPKDLVIGIEINGNYKAYLEKSIKIGETKDELSGEEITIIKNEAGEIRFFKGKDKTPISGIWGFWFSWQAVHPDTDLYK